VQSLPTDFDPATLAAALTREWGVAVASLDHAPVGFGSHHWVATDPAGGRWFVTVDDLRVTRTADDEPLDSAFGRLRRALDTARGLRDTGAEFVVAPVPTAGGDTVVRLSDEWTAALYPHLEGQSFAWDDWRGDAHRQAVLDMVVGVHAAPPAVRARAGVDDLSVPHRDAVEAGLAGRPPAGDGPYAARTAALLADNAAAIAAWFAGYDRIAAAVPRDRDVLTHGEIHPGNSMRTADGWRLIDWDTALVAPPERDLWMLGAEATAAYATATGVVARPETIEAYRRWWDVADLAVSVARFRGPHTGGEDDDSTWAIIERLVTELPVGPPPASAA
jgi:spectinomycin phosphotransferase/16S rRNA (guanine(1405)-N(7))-methyltransferase